LAAKRHDRILDSSELLIKIRAVHHPACYAIVALVEGIPPFIVGVPLLNLLDGFQGIFTLKCGDLRLSSCMRIFVSYKVCTAMVI
jgi:hypothetical protein